MPDYRAMAGDAGVAHGLPRDRFIRQIGVESVNYAVNVIECRLDSPAGARGIAQLMPIHWSQVDPCDPNAALDYAARLMRGHWDYWRGQGKSGDVAYGLALASYNAGRQATIDGLAGRKAWWPFVETVTYLTRILQVDDSQARAIMTGSKPVGVMYNASEPTHPQENQFDCSQDSLEWAMHALGRAPKDNWMEPTMIAEGVMSVANGLEDASGAGLAAFVGRHWGEFGFYANHEPAVSFDDVANEGTGPGINGKAYPLLLGGRAWGHWSGVRGYDAARDVLLLSNPADGWKGVGQIMSRAQWANLGPFSMVRVLHPDLLKVFDAPALPAPTPEPPTPPAVEPWRVQLAQKLREALAIVEAAPG